MGIRVYLRKMDIVMTGIVLYAKIHQNYGLRGNGINEHSDQTGKTDKKEETKET